MGQTGKVAFLRQMEGNVFTFMIDDAMYTMTFSELEDSDLEMVRDNPGQYEMLFKKCLADGGFPVGSVVIDFFI